METIKTGFGAGNGAISLHLMLCGFPPAASPARWCSNLWYPVRWKATWPLSGRAPCGSPIRVGNGRTNRGAMRPFPAPEARPIG